MEVMNKLNKNLLLIQPLSRRSDVDFGSSIVKFIMRFSLSKSSAVVNLQWTNLSNSTEHEKNFTYVNQGHSLSQIFWVACRAGSAA